MKNLSIVNSLFFNNTGHKSIKKVQTYKISLNFSTFKEVHFFLDPEIYIIFAT